MAVVAVTRARRHDRLRVPICRPCRLVAGRCVGHDCSAVRRDFGSNRERSRQRATSGSGDGTCNVWASGARHRLAGWVLSVALPSGRVRGSGEWEMLQWEERAWACRLPVVRVTYLSYID